MVCIRCKMIVKDELLKLGIRSANVNLGEVDLAESITAIQYEQLNYALLKWGLELMDDGRSILIEKIKNVIFETIHFSEDKLPNNFSDHISRKLNYDYTYLSNLFSEVQGITIEHFMIALKIERVKELLVYDELNLTEIAWKLHYSSVAHLSNQFKKVTGLTPTHFKLLRKKKRAIPGNL